MGALKVAQRAVTAGTALTNSTAETVLGSFVAPAYFYQTGKILDVTAAVRSTAQNSTDTLTVRVRFGPTTLTGTALFTSAAVDQVADDTCVIRMQLIVRDADSSGTLVACGFASPPDATGTAAVSIAPVPVTALDFTAEQRLEITGQWSVASASNSCQLELLNVLEVV